MGVEHDVTSRPATIAYVVKRFPRASETFIAQELLELERRGARLCVFALHPPDEPLRHAWLADLEAEVVHVPQAPIGATWEALRARLEHAPERRTGTLRALRWAFESPRGRRDLGQALAIVEAARERGVDRLHAHFANRPAFVALLAHALSGLSFSFTAHAKDIYAAPPSPEVWRRLVRHADFVATVSDANRAHLVEQLGARLGRKVVRLYNGVDLESIRPIEAKVDGNRDGLPLRLLCVARLVPKKGLGTLLRAAALLRDRDLAFACTIVGDGPEAPALREQVERLGLDDRVQLAGALPHEAVVQRLHETDVFALPCRVGEDGDRDALPTVLLEAMAAGLPCVSTPVGGIPEIIEHGRTGYLVPSDDPERLARTLAGLARDRTERERLGSEGRRRAARLFDLRRNAGVLHGWLRA